LALVRSIELLAMDTQPTPDLASESAQTETTVPAKPSPAELDRYECRPCGYVYEPVRGDKAGNIPPGSAFEDLSPTWRCPVCGASAKAFANIGPVGSTSGFKENYGYGFGVNTLTPGQKNLLIFSGLAIGFLVLLSFYGLG
jgi:rubredoxin